MGFDLSYPEFGDELTKLKSFPALEIIRLGPSQVTARALDEIKRIQTLKRVILNRERAPWGKQDRGARNFDEFMMHWHHDLPGFNVALNEPFWAMQCVEF